MHSYSTDQPRRHQWYIWIGVIAASITFLPLAVGSLIGIPLGLLVGGLYYGFTRWLWKWSVLRTYNIVEVPVLDGKWEGYLYTSKDPAKIDDELIVKTGKQRDGLTKMETSLTIQQTWDKVLVSLDGPESNSGSRGATILVKDNAWPTIAYNYVNDGGYTNDDLDMHYGTTTLQYDAGENKLIGPYYTRPDQRGNHGLLELCRKSSD